MSTTPCSFISTTDARMAESWLTAMSPSVPLAALKSATARFWAWLSPHAATAPASTRAAARRIGVRVGCTGAPLYLARRGFDRASARAALLNARLTALTANAACENPPRDGIEARRSRRRRRRSSPSDRTAPAHPDRCAEEPFGSFALPQAVADPVPRVGRA